MRDYGSEIRELREKAGLTQQQLADLMGWSWSKQSRIENNRQILYIDEHEELMMMLSAKLVMRMEMDWPVTRLVTA